MINQRVSTLTLLALLGLSTGAHAGAQVSPPPEAGIRATYADPAVEALVAEALRKNADVAASTADAEAAGLRIAPAKTLPDPFLSLTYQNDGWALSLGERDMTFLGAMIAQPLPWPGKLRLAGEEATLRADEARVGSVGRSRLGVEARIRRAYYDYLLARDLLGLVEDRRRASREIEEIARQRYAAGVGIQQDALRAQVELLKLDEARTDGDAQVANRLAELNRLLDRPQDGPLDADQHLELRPQTPQLSELLAAVRDRSPELAALSTGIEADRSRVALRKKDFLPDFVASGGPMYRGGLDPMWQVGLGITLPIHVGSRLKPRLAEAEAELRADQGRLSSAALELELQTRQRFQNLDAALRVARLYREGIIPTDQLSLEAAVASYRTGAVPFLTVLEALNTLYADRAILLTRLADSEKWRVAIDESDLPAAAPISWAPAASSSMAPSSSMR